MRACRIFLQKKAGGGEAVLRELGNSPGAGPVGSEGTAGKVGVEGRGGTAGVASGAGTLLLGGQNRELGSPSWRRMISCVVKGFSDTRQTLGTGIMF